jgi:hypothetical protein
MASGTGICSPLTNFSQIYDSKPTVLSFCVAADVGMQIFNAKDDGMSSKPPIKLSGLVKNSYDELMYFLNKYVYLCDKTKLL